MADPLEALIGLKLTHGVGGILGALVRSLIKKDSMIAGFISITVGGICSLYGTTPAYLWMTTYIPSIAVPSTEHMMSFLIGVTGMTLCEGIMIKAKRWSDNPTFPKPPNGGNP